MADQAYFLEKCILKNLLTTNCKHQQAKFRRFLQLLFVD